MQSRSIPFQNDPVTVIHEATALLDSPCLTDLGRANDGGPLRGRRLSPDHDPDESGFSDQRIRRAAFDDALKQPYSPLARCHRAMTRPRTRCVSQPPPKA